MIEGQEHLRAAVQRDAGQVAQLDFEWGLKKMRVGFDDASSAIYRLGSGLNEAVLQEFTPVTAGGINPTVLSLCLAIPIVGIPCVVIVFAGVVASLVTMALLTVVGCVLFLRLNQPL